MEMENKNKNNNNRNFLSQWHINALLLAKGASETLEILYALTLRDREIE